MSNLKETQKHNKGEAVLPSRPLIGLADAQDDNAERHWHRCPRSKEIRYCIETRCQPNPCISREALHKQLCEKCISQTWFYKMLITK